MASNKHKAFKVLLWFVAIYHILIGSLGVFAKGTVVAVANNFFNFNLTATDQVLWIINPFATYLLFFGVFMGVAATNPEKYRNLIYAGVGLFAVRVIQRIIFVIDAPEGLIVNADPIRNIIFIAVVASLGSLMFILAKKKLR